MALLLVVATGVGGALLWQCPGCNSVGASTSQVWQRGGNWACIVMLISRLKPFQKGVGTWNSWPKITPEIIDLAGVSKNAGFGPYFRFGKLEWLGWELRSHTERLKIRFDFGLAHILGQVPISGLGQKKSIRTPQVVPKVKGEGSHTGRGSAAFWAAFQPPIRGSLHAAMTWGEWRRGSHQLLPDEQVFGP
jgi:hypothetical protein